MTTKHRIPTIEAEPRRINRRLTLWHFACPCCGNFHAAERLGVQSPICGTWARVCLIASDTVNEAHKC